eukprot:TRINITY_DN37143_c0_g1_i1.p1 TRINITY_DN37143_c0_g1~~TRINITY_DN37143_c0_g1_i1.p1  ORF type:complete len:549 (+),score=137.68 TRINITY_DN37143_c0_g1_i1:113-1759(+)
MVQATGDAERAAAVAASERLKERNEAENGGPQTPLQKKYFSADMMTRYEPMAEAMAKVDAQAEGEEEPDIFAELDEHWDRFMDFSWASQWNGKKFDVVFYGASGYQGYLMMQYLKRVALKPGREQFTFAFAGRSASKVAEMRDREFRNTQWEDTPVLSASYDDVVSIIDLVKSAHVVVNVAGPYMLTEGEVLVDACIWCKADYVDVSMEVPWGVRVKDLHRYALDAGVMVVPSCCSSAYPDLGVHLLAKKIQDDFGEALRSAVCYCAGGGHAAGVSGGALKTRAALSAAAGSNQEDAQALMDPFSLGGFIPQIDRNGVKQVDIQMGTGFVTPKPREEDQDVNMARVTEDQKMGVWRAPYVNSFFDTRLVRRSNMLQADLANQPYGATLNFMEYAMLPPERVAGAKQALAENSNQTFEPMGQYGITVEEERKLLKIEGKEFRSGQGPAVEDMSDAWTGFFLAAESVNGNQEKCSFVAADGYFESSRVAVETALTLRFDRDRLQFRGGVLTPSVAGGTCLVERLIRTGVKFMMGGWLEASELAPPDLGDE